MSLEHLGSSKSLLSGELNVSLIACRAQGVTTNDGGERGVSVH